MQDDKPESIYGEDDPKVIRAARAIAEKRNARLVAQGMESQGLLPQDIEDAQAALATVGMLRLVPARTPLIPEAGSLHLFDKRNKKV